MPCDCSGYTKPEIYIEKNLIEAIKLLSASAQMELICQVCKFLTREEMLNIQPCSDVIPLLNMYVDHLFHDLTNPESAEEEKHIANNELRRLKIDYTSINGGFEYRI